MFTESEKLCHIAITTTTTPRVPMQGPCRRNSEKRERTEGGEGGDDSMHDDPTPPTSQQRHAFSGEIRRGLKKRVK